MTRDEFRNALHILITDSTDVPIAQVADELEDAKRWMAYLKDFEERYQQTPGA